MPLGALWTLPNTSVPPSSTLRAVGSSAGDSTCCADRGPDSKVQASDTSPTLSPTWQDLYLHSWAWNSGCLLTVAWLGIGRPPHG